MKKIFDFGKIALRGTRKTNAVTVEVELTEDDCFSVSACVWNLKHTDCVMGGQCLDDLDKFEELHNNPTFSTIYKMWKLHHLNDMHAGTEAQEKALEKVGLRSASDYVKACEYLESIGIYDDNGYKYGTGWLKREIPSADLMTIKKLLVA